MKPLRREKFSSLSSPSTRETKPLLRKVTCPGGVPIMPVLLIVTIEWSHMLPVTHAWCRSSAAEGFRWRGTSSRTHRRTEPAPDFHSRLRNIWFPSDREICWDATMKCTSEDKWFVNWSLLNFALELVLAVGPRCEHEWLIFWSGLDSATTTVCCQLQGSQALTHILNLPSTIIHSKFIHCKNESEMHFMHAASRVSPLVMQIMHD